jgi:hypothetical protein
VRYTIEYLDARDSGPQHLITPIIFNDKEMALESACVLLRAGFPVLKVAGPGFEMGKAALAAYAAARQRRGAKSR